MSLSFTHETLPQRVVFASREVMRHVADEVARLASSSCGADVAAPSMTAS